MFVILGVSRADSQTVLAPSGVGTGFEGSPTASEVQYDPYGYTDASVVAWMAENAEARGIPGALPVTVALHETELRNIPQYGCEDPSTSFEGCAYGYFQQTPPYWGTVQQVMDPVYALDAFLDAAEQYTGQYGDDCYSLAAWGQAVQRAGIIRDMPGYCEQAKAVLGEGGAYQYVDATSVAYDQYSTASPESVAYDQYASATPSGSVAQDQYAQDAAHSLYQYADSGGTAVVDAAGNPDLVVDVGYAGDAVSMQTASYPVGGAGTGAGIRVVQPGETLSGIALETGTSVEYLAAYNGVVDPNLIYSGQVLYY